MPFPIIAAVAARALAPLAARAVGSGVAKTATRMAVTKAVTPSAPAPEPPANSNLNSRQFGSTQSPPTQGF